jgi:hypothetical protein
MKVLAQFLLCGLITLPAFAQRGGGMHGGGMHGGGGFPSGGGFHGGVGGGYSHGGVMGGYRGGGFVGSGFGYRTPVYGGFRYGGFYHHHGFYRSRFFFGFGLGGFFPYAYPWYGGYGYGYPYDPYYPDYYSYQPPSNVAYYPSEPAPDYSYAPPAPPLRPEVREYRGSAPSSSRAYEKPIYLIAFKNQDNIRAAEAYWVDNGTLNYVTLQHERKQAPLDSVDRAFSGRLNRERHVDFRLPPE